MASSRRKLLAIAGIGIAGAGSWVLLRGSWLKSLLVAQKQDGPPNPAPAAAKAAPVIASNDATMSARTQATLRAAVRWVIGREVDLAGYDDYFAWRSRHVPGAGVLYERFAATAEVTARMESAPTFAACDEWARARVFVRLFEQPSLQPLRDEILRRFSRTEAWLALGYDGFPGTPRGLDDYLVPLPGARGG